MKSQTLRADASREGQFKVLVTVQTLGRERRIFNHLIELWLRYLSIMR